MILTMYGFVQVCSLTFLSFSYIGNGSEQVVAQMKVHAWKGKTTSLLFSQLPPFPQSYVC